MILQIADVLDAPELDALGDVMNDNSLFEPGRNTAGWYAQPRKNNLQAGDTALSKGAIAKIGKALKRNAVFQSAARPKSVAKILLSRYEDGMGYGTHVDDAMIAGQRTDLSFTLFLSAPDTYDGGELTIDSPEGERSFKLPAGHLVLYPSTTLHRVEPVAGGTRLTAVGWVRSLVREAAAREILFDLDHAIGTLHRNAATDLDTTLDLLMKTRSNLLRRWVED